MRNITVDIEQSKIEDLAVLINEITEDIKNSKGAALEDLDKKKTWRQKFHEFCKFSKGNQKVVLKDTLEDVRDTNVLLQLLTALSKKIYEEHNEVLIEVLKNLEDLYSDIKDINDFKEELKKEVQEEIKELKEFHTNKLNIRNRSNLADENINLLLSTISFIYHLKEDHSKIEQEYLESIKIFFNRGSYDIEDINIDNNNISQIEHKQAEIFYAFVLEAIAILYNEDKSNPVSITTINSDIISYILDEIGLAGSIKKKIELDVNKELNDYSKIDIHFVKKYEKHIDNEDYLLDDFAFVIDENLENDSYNDYVYEEKNTAFDETINEDAESLSEMEDEIISSILQIRPNETKIFKNKKIHMRAYINCQGRIEFDKCTLYYNETESGDEITLADNATLIIKNSTVICKSLDDHPFITCESNNNVHIEKTEFIDCAYFINSGYSSTNSFLMKECKVINCYSDFIRIHANDKSICDISDNIIISDELNTYYYDKIAEKPRLKKFSSHSETLFTVCSSENKVKFHNNVIIENREENINSKDYHQLCFFECNNAEISNCSFSGLSTAIKAPWIKDCKFTKCSESVRIYSKWNSKKRPLIDNCVFEDSTNVIQADDNTFISNCQFISCYNNIIMSNGYNGGVIIEFCQFINTKDLRNSFMDNACITFRRSKESESSANYLKKCIFDGVELNNSFLIAAKGYEKPSGTVTYINECDFKNCSTKRFSEKIIREYIQYDTLFKKNKDFHANEISPNCRGLDKINQEAKKTSNVEIKTTSSTTGNPIGSVLMLPDSIVFTN